MQLRRVSLLAAMVLTFAGIAPVAAAAQPVSVASCGTSAGMWTGSFDGNRRVIAYPDATPRLRADVSLSGSTLAVHTVINDDQNPNHPDGTPSIPNGNLVWTAWHYALPFAYYDTYTTNSVTCSGGRVTAFSGEVTYVAKWIGPFAGVEPMGTTYATFTLTRTS